MTTDSDAWTRFWEGAQELRVALNRSTAVNVNASHLRASAQSSVQTYFREVRPELATLVDDQAVLSELDDHLQALLRLSQGANPRASYVRVVKEITRKQAVLSGLREIAIGATAAKRLVHAGGMSDTESRVYATIDRMLPATARSYQQAIADLSDLGRISFRGTAVELRETLREVLDHLAPDAAVESDVGFELEKDRRSPTMRQKASFVLRSRGLSQASRKGPQDAVALVEGLTASLVRSAYERGSGATHSAPDRASVQRLKMWIETVLSELLEV